MDSIHSHPIDILYLNVHISHEKWLILHHFNLHFLSTKYTLVQQAVLGYESPQQQVYTITPMTTVPDECTMHSYRLNREQPSPSCYRYAYDSPTHSSTSQVTLVYYHP